MESEVFPERESERLRELGEGAFCLAARDILVNERSLEHWLSRQDVSESFSQCFQQSTVSDAKTSSSQYLGYREISN
jgi:transcriptional regulator GlxA family with amidase domain